MCESVMVSQAMGPVCCAEDILNTFAACELSPDSNLHAPNAETGPHQLPQAETAC